MSFNNRDDVILQLLEKINSGFLHHAFWFCANILISLYFGVLFGDQTITLIGWFLVFLYNAWLIESWLKGKKHEPED